MYGSFPPLKKKHIIHVWNIIYLYIYHENQRNVGKYMDPMGLIRQFHSSTETLQLSWRSRKKTTSDRPIYIHVIGPQKL